MDQQQLKSLRASNRKNTLIVFWKCNENGWVFMGSNTCFRSVWISKFAEDGANEASEKLHWYAQKTMCSIHFELAAAATAALCIQNCNSTCLLACAASGFTYYTLHSHDSTQMLGTVDSVLLIMMMIIAAQLSGNHQYSIEHYIRNFDMTCAVMTV